MFNWILCWKVKERESEHCKNSFRMQRKPLMGQTRQPSWWPKWPKLVANQQTKCNSHVGALPKFSDVFVAWGCRLKVDLKYQLLSFLWRLGNFPTNEKEQVPINKLPAQPFGCRNPEPEPYIWVQGKCQGTGYCCSPSFISGFKASENSWELHGRKDLQLFDALNHTIE